MVKRSRLAPSCSGFSSGADASHVLSTSEMSTYATSPPHEAVSAAMRAAAAGARRKADLRVMGSSGGGGSGCRRRKGGGAEGAALGLAREGALGRPGDAGGRARRLSRAQEQEVDPAG